jgi:hypothetical protein
LAGWSDKRFSISKDGEFFKMIALKITTLVVCAGAFVELLLSTDIGAEVVLAIAVCFS